MKQIMSAKIKMRNRTDIKRILILELGGIGDVILSIPAVLAIRECFREADITVLTVPRTATVIERLGVRDELSESGRKRGFDVKFFPLYHGMPWSRETFTLLTSLRKQNFDLLVDLSAIESKASGFKRDLLVRSVGAGWSVGRGTDGRGQFFDESTSEDLGSEHHEMERKLEVAALLGARGKTTAPLFPVFEPDRNSAGMVLEENMIHPGMLLVGIHPGGLAAGKRWPPDRFVPAVKWIRNNLGAAALVIGGPDAKPYVEQVCAGTGDPSVVPVISHPLGTVAALIERCSLFLTNDSGPMHLAAALGIPTAAIFGQTNPARYSPLLPRSRKECVFADPGLCVDGWTGGMKDECRKVDCGDPKCLDAVSVDHVISMMETLCSRVGILYSARVQPEPVSRGAAPFPRPDHDVAKEDAGYITSRARKLSIDLLRGADGPVLDVACGKGYFLGDLRCASSDGRELWGVDISMEQLTRAEKNLTRRDRHEKNKSPRLIRGDLKALPFRSEVFSSSVCINTLLNLNGNGGLDLYLSEISRVTKKNGKVCIEVRNSKNPLVVLRFLYGRIARRIPLNIHRTADVVRAAERAGLELSGSKPVGPLGGFLAYAHVLVFKKVRQRC